VESGAATSMWTLSEDISALARRRISRQLMAKALPSRPMQMFSATERLVQRFTS
jgi:hypothetical protein